jgi:hypothetical protein
VSLVNAVTGFDASNRKFVAVIRVRDGDEPLRPPLIDAPATGRPYR